MNQTTETAPARILCVDDEPNLLAALERSLGEEFDISTATSGEQALARMADEPPFAVVMADMRMPGMDGASFLSHVRSRYPQTVRVLLTGYADTQSAMAAVNQGAIFRFLSKPCPRELLAGTLHQAVAHHRAIQAEQALLETTLLRLVNLLSEVMAMASPRAFRRATFVRTCVREALPRLGWPDAWQYETAAALSQIGQIGLSADREDEPDAGEAGAQTAWRLLSPIPRLGTVAEMVRYQWREPPSEVSAMVRQGAQLLRAALQVEAASRKARHGTADVARLLSSMEPPPPEAIIESLRHFRWRFDLQKREKISQLMAGSLLDEDLRTETGVLVLSKGHELTEAAIVTLRELRKSQTIGDSVLVRYPQRSES